MKKSIFFAIVFFSLILSLFADDQTAIQSANQIGSDVLQKYGTEGGFKTNVADPAQENKPIQTSDSSNMGITEKKGDFVKIRIGKQYVNTELLFNYFEVSIDTDLNGSFEKVITFSKPIYTACYNYLIEETIEIGTDKIIETYYYFDTNLNFVQYDENFVESAYGNEYQLNWCYCLKKSCGEALQTDFVRLAENVRDGIIRQIIKKYPKISVTEKPSVRESEDIIRFEYFGAIIGKDTNQDMSDVDDFVAQAYIDEPDVSIDKNMLNQAKPTNVNRDTSSGLISYTSIDKDGNPVNRDALFKTDGYPGLDCIPSCYVVAGHAGIKDSEYLKKGVEYDYSSQIPSNSTAQNAHTVSDFRQSVTSSSTGLQRLCYPTGDVNSENKLIFVCPLGAGEAIQKDCTCEQNLQNLISAEAHNQAMNDKVCSE